MNVINDSYYNLSPTISYNGQLINNPNEQQQ